MQINIKLTDEEEIEETEPSTIKVKIVKSDSEEGESVDTAECPDGTMKEPGLVSGEKGGTAECPDEDPMPMDDTATLPESTGFDKDFGAEFDHLFEDHDDDDDGEDSDIDECMMDLPVEEEEEAEIVVKVNEGLFDNRDKLLFEKLLMWSSK